MRNLKKIEVGLLSVAVFSEIASFPYPFFADIALLVEYGVFVLFINEIPSLLNRFYRTKVFRERVFLRLVIASSFVILYFLFAFFLGGFMLPFLRIPSISVSQFSKTWPLLFFSALCFVLVMAFFVSLEVRKTPDLVLAVSKRWSSEDEFAQTKYEMERSCIDLLLNAYSVGLLISALSVFLFGLWMLTWFLSPLFLLVMILWLVHDILLLRKKTFFNRLVGALRTSDDQIDSAFGWKGFLRPLFSGPKGATISLLVLLCYGSFGVFITALLPYPFYALVFWAIFCCWYVFLILICLTWRLNNELYLLRGTNRNAYATPLPPYKNLVLVLIFACILAWSTVILFPDYMNMYSRFLLLSLSIGANVAALASVAVYFKKRKYREKEIVKYKSVMHDRYRVVIVSFLTSILLSVISETHVLLECVLVVVVFQTYLFDLGPRIKNWKPLPYSMISGVVSFVMLGILTIALSLFQLGGGYPFADFVPLFLPFGIVFSLYGVIISFRAQTLRHRRLRES